ncbi:uncharacterized protein LOC144436374 isoform X2 [Glandiceps talaboti]
MMGGSTRVIQVTNVAPAATLDQMKTLFGFLGDIEDIKLFPREDSPLPVTSRVCFVKYEDFASVGVAQHLTNTVFIDRALIVVPCGDGIIPDENKALAIAAPANAVAGLMPTPGGGLLPTPAPGILGQVPSLVGLTNAAQITAPFDPTLAALGLPQPPPLPGNVDPSKIEEIRRTIYVGNLDSQTVTAEQLLNFFSQVGEVKYVRMAGDETQPTRFAFVEFSDQKSVAAALTYNGVMFGGRPLKINHSNNAIVKPQTKTPEAAAREMEEAMKRVRDAQALIQAAIDPELGPKTGSSTDEFGEGGEIKKKKSRSRSRSKEKDRNRRSRSRSHSRRRSRSRSRKRSRSRGRRSRSPRKRSRSPRPKRRSRSRSKDRRRSRSRSPSSKKIFAISSRDHKRSRTPPRSYRRYSRSRSRERRRRSPTPPRPRGSRGRRRSRSPKRRSRSSSESPKRSRRKKKDKDRDRDRSRERDSGKSKKHKKDKERDRERERERDRDRDREHRESKSKEVKVTRDYDEEEKGYDSEKERESSGSSKERHDDDHPVIKTERDFSPKENTEQMDMDLSD